MSRWKVDRPFAVATAALLGATFIAGCLAGPSTNDIQVPQVSKRILDGGSSQGLASRGPNNQLVRAIAMAGDSVSADTVAWVRPADPQAGGSLSFPIVGAQGGTFQFGRYRLYFPPNAVRGNGTVTISVPDANIVGCNLTISPARLNGFDQPVVLTMACDNTDLSVAGVAALNTALPLAKSGPPTSLGARSPHLQGTILGTPDGGKGGKPLTGVYWESPDGWVWVGGDVNAGTWEVKSPLKHFSNYRAGW